MKPNVKTFFDEATFTATHVVWDPQTRHAAIVDSVKDYDPKSGRTSTDSADQVIAFVRDQNLTIEWILETHVHADHLTAAPYLKEKLGGKLEAGPQADTKSKKHTIASVKQHFYELEDRFNIFLRL